jgi:predicted component of type VI protein secretion system
MKAELVPDNGDPPIPITRDVTVVGRRPYCDVVVDHPSLSKRHCVIVKTDGLLVVRDLASTNGTKVKGQKIRWAALLPDDRLTFGSYKVRIYLGPDDAPGPSELARWGASAKRTKGAAAEAPPAPRASAADRFEAPSPTSVPAVQAEAAWAIDVDDEDDSPSDSAWRDQLGAGAGSDEEDAIIELE